MDNRRLKKVLIIKPSSLGDIIHALPVAAALKKAVPGVQVDWAVFKAYEPVLSGHPAITNVISFDRSKSGCGELSRFMKALRAEEYDAAIDLQGLLRSGIIIFACGAGEKIGLRNAREGAHFFYNKKISVPDPEMHAVDRYLLTLGAFGIPAPETPEFNITAGPEDLIEAGRVLKDAGINEGEEFIAIAPSSRWITKRWPAENFVRAALALKESRGLKYIFIGSADEAGVMSGSEDRAGRESLAFGKTSLKSLAALLGKARLMITNDSGPMHIAAAVGTDVLAIFGPTIPERTGPYGKGHRVITSGAPCAPCLKKECTDTERDMRCMKEITVEYVLHSAEEMLEGKDDKQGTA